MESLDCCKLEENKEYAELKSVDGKHLFSQVHLLTYHPCMVIPLQNNLSLCMDQKVLPAISRSFR